MHRGKRTPRTIGNELKARADALADKLQDMINLAVAGMEDANENGDSEWNVALETAASRAALAAHRSGHPAAKKVPLAMLRECWEACNDPMNGEIMYRDIFGPIVARYGYEGTE